MALARQLTQARLLHQRHGKVLPGLEGAHPGNVCRDMFVELSESSGETLMEVRLHLPS
jgi:hypothetical protein